MIDHIIFLATVISSIAAYGWVMYIIGYKKGQDVIHEWYAQPLDPEHKTSSLIEGQVE